MANKIEEPEGKRHAFGPDDWTDDDIVCRVDNWIWDRATDTLDMIQREEDSLSRWMGQRQKAEESLPWKGASNLDMGGLATQGHVETIHSQVLKILRSSWPWFRFEGDPAQAAQAMAYMVQKFKKEVPIMDFVDQWIHDALVGGFRLARVRWERDFRLEGDIWYINPKVLNPEGQNVWDMNDGDYRIYLTLALSNRFAKVREITFSGEGTYSCSAEISGKRVTIKGDYEPEGTRIKVTARYVRLHKNDVAYDLVYPEDFWKSAGPVHTCKYLIHRVWLPWTEIVSRVNNGLYHNIDLKADWVYSTDPVNQTEGGAGMVEMRREMAGEAPVVPQQDRYEFLEVFILDRFGTRELQERFITIFRDKHVVVRNVLLSEDGFPARPFSHIGIQPVPGKPDYAWGIPSLVAPAADEITAVHNLMMDIATIRGIPFFFYDATVPYGETMLRLAPGKGLPLNPGNTEQLSSSVYFPMLNGQIGELNGMFQQIDSVAKAIDGVNSTQLSQVPKARTAKQSQMEETVSNVRFEVFLDRIIGSVSGKSGLTWLMDLTTRLYQKFGTPVEVEVLSGLSSPLSFPENPNIALKLDADVLALDGQRRIQRSQTVLQTVMNPALLQLKVVGPEEVYHAIHDVLHSMGVTDPSRYVSKPPENAAPKPPNEENARLANGETLNVNPIDNDAEHLLSHRSFSQTLQEMADQFPPEMMNVIAQVFSNHIRQHVKQESSKRQAQTSAVQGLNINNPDATPSFGKMGFLPPSGGGPAGATMGAPESPPEQGAPAPPPGAGMMPQGPPQ